MLVSNTTEINAWFPNSTELDGELPSIQPYLEAAEQRILAPILGTPLYHFLQQEYEAKDKASNEHSKDLLERAQAVIILFGIYGALPALNVTINKSGSLTVTINSNTVAASKDRTDKLIESTYTHANDAVEQLLLYLEKNSSYFVDSETNEELWKQSERYWQKTGCLIFTATEFNDIVFIDNSRILFNRIYPSIRLMERVKLRPAFGAELIRAIITRKMNNQLKGHDAELLEHMQTALALLTVSQSEELSKPDSIHGYKPMDCDQMAETEINAAKSILRAYPEEYPEYIGNKENPEVTIRYRNENDKAMFVMGGPVR